jgi:hypothetical protein
METAPPAIEVDPRLTLIDKVDTARAALADGLALRTLAHVLEDNRIPRSELEGELLSAPGMILANILQTLVVHETVYADGILFEDSGLSSAEALFPGIVRRLYIPLELRSDIADTINRLSGFICRSGTPNRQESELLDYQTVIEKPVLDDLSSRKFKTLKVPTDLVINEQITRDALIWNMIGLNLPSAVLASTKPEARAQFYLLTAQKTGIGLAASPAYSMYFDRMLGVLDTALAADTPSDLLRRFQDLLLSKELIARWRDEGVLTSEVIIPPVPEYVIRYARRKGIGLRDALMEVRNSKSAREFRDWCARIRTLREIATPGSLLERERMMRDLMLLGKKWSENLGADTGYRVRRLKLSKLAQGLVEWIPVVGASLGKMAEAIIPEDISVNVKELWKQPSLPCELFLTDIYAGPSAYRQTTP